MIDWAMHLLLGAAIGTLGGIFGIGGGLIAIPALVLMFGICLLYTSPSPRDRQKSRMPSSA